ncbi:hypothetical protein NX722_23615 [Endozoicomonas gorgoniicola]|uniref:Uncharacterized protein n=1 Tax=Endozoicomonas gorgoniicola TaxID=1234144 RepID=A0ABT3N1Q7_9GAMM|nr:hypothetical protein [Endozoicomonas gorgoniicola]MCW7555556.1 hypothetical protein [Endozoicomonas gorgoniicola]
MDIEYAKRILVHYFKLAGVADSYDNISEIECAVDAIYQAAVREAKSQIRIGDKLEEGQEEKMLIKGTICKNCGNKEGMGNECQLETTRKGNFYIHCPDCGVESGVHDTTQKAADDFFQKPHNPVVITPKYETE